MTEIKRGLSKKLGGTLAGIERESDRSQTKTERKLALTLLMQLGERFISGAERTKLWLRKDLLFGNKRLDLTEG